MVEQEIARSVAQHLMQRRPRRRRVERRVEQLLDPGGDTGFPSRDSRYCAAARRCPPSRAAAAARSARTAISRVIVLHSAGARSRASVARHVPAAGDATSANQKYGGPPCRSRDLAATLPSGAISESSPSSGFSAAKMTRRGAPFHGATGEGRTASSAASSQVPDRALRLCVHCREQADEKCACDQQRCCRSSSKLACWKQSSPRPWPQSSTIAKSFG